MLVDVRKGDTAVLLGEDAAARLKARLVAVDAVEKLHADAVILSCASKLDRK